MLKLIKRKKTKYDKFVRLTEIKLSPTVLVCNVLGFTLAAGAQDSQNLLLRGCNYTYTSIQHMFYPMF